MSAVDETSLQSIIDTVYVHRLCVFVNNIFVRVRAIIENSETIERTAEK